jgi:hypothetical protein
VITRGHFIGEVVDELAAIGEQVKMRNRLGLTDLTVYTENFFRDVLSLLLNASLINLNEDRSNEPGLDLGDANAKLGVQVTSTASAAKVNSTLKKITSVQAKQYKAIVVLVVGHKQGSYALDQTLAKKFKFTERSIWDLNKLGRLTIGLDIDRLQRLHRLIRSEVARVKVELEIPDREGKYPTSAFDLWEARVEPKIGSGENFLQFIERDPNTELSEKDRTEIKESIKAFAKRLSRLPRVTREFFAVLWERRERRKRSEHFGSDWPYLLMSKVEREFRGEDLRGEIQILDHADLISLSESEGNYAPPEIGLRLSDNDYVSGYFLDFAAEKGLSLKKIIGEVDLSNF